MEFLFWTSSIIYQAKKESSNKVIAKLQKLQNILMSIVLNVKLKDNAGDDWLSIRQPNETFNIN
jgi:hypothetical protein